MQNEAQSYQKKIKHQNVRECLTFAYIPLATRHDVAI